MNRMLCSDKSSDGGSSNAGQWEMRPGGMLVQQRNSDANNPTFNPIPTIRVRVKYGSSYHDIYVSSQASFGTKKLLNSFVISTVFLFHVTFLAL